jgi:hypothetical protein
MGRTRAVLGVLFSRCTASPTAPPTAVETRALIGHFELSCPKTAIPQTRWLWSQHLDQLLTLPCLGLATGSTRSFKGQKRRRNLRSQLWRITSESWAWPSIRARPSHPRAVREFGRAVTCFSRTTRGQHSWLPQPRPLVLLGGPLQTKFCYFTRTFRLRARNLRLRLRPISASKAYCALST